MAILTPLSLSTVSLHGTACTYDVTAHRMERSHPLSLPEVVERQMTVQGGSRLIEGHFETWFLRVLLVRRYALFLHTSILNAVCGWREVLMEDCSSDVQGLEEESEADTHVATSLTRTPEWLAMMREVELQKICFNQTDSHSFRLHAFGHLQPRLSELLTPDRLHARLSNMPKYASLGRFGRGTIVLQRELMASFFEPVARTAAAFVKAQHDTVGGAAACPVINLSGGFGCSDVLFKLIKEEVGPGVRVVKVGKPNLAVVRGALIHALTQPVMTRVLDKSFGVLITHPFTPTNPAHCLLAENPANMEVLNGVRHVRQFKTLVTRGQSVDVAKRIDVGDYWPTSLDKWEAT